MFPQAPVQTTSVFPVSTSCVIIHPASETQSRVIFNQPLIQSHHPSVLLLLWIMAGIIIQPDTEIVLCSFTGPGSVLRTGDVRVTKTWLSLLEAQYLAKEVNCEHLTHNIMCTYEHSVLFTLPTSNCSSILAHSASQMSLKSMLFSLVLWSLPWIKSFYFPACAGAVVSWLAFLSSLFSRSIPTPSPMCCHCLKHWSESVIPWLINHHGLGGPQ